MTPTQRTLAYLRKLGYTPGITEHWNPHVRQRKDLYGFADIVTPDHITKRGVIAIQCTSGSNVAARQTKIEGIPEAVLWLECGNAIWVIGWRKLKGRGRQQWFPTRREASLSGGAIRWGEGE